MPVFIENSTPAKPAIVAEAIREPHTRRSVRTPARRAASALPPVAYSRRPSGVCSSTNHTTVAITSR